MGKPTPTQYTLRSVPPAVDRKLRDVARRTGKSLNRVALEALARGAGVTQEQVPRRDVDYLVGSWKPEADVVEAFAAMRAMDPKLWR